MLSFEKNEKWSSSKNLLPLDPKVYVTIVDVGMIWQIFAPTWGDWEIIIVNDPCNFLCSIKDEERDRQKQGN